MDPLLLARLQFATTTSIHFLFVLVTLGLVTLLVYLQTAWLITGKPRYERLTRFWGTLYLINYSLGIATGIVLEFQLGLNWSGLSRYAGNVIAAPLAVETLVAFFLESTCLGMWIFGWHRLRRGVHLALLYGVAITAYASAFWVLVANAWMQSPVGYELKEGPDGDQLVQLADFGALVSNPAFGTTLGHVLAAALTTGGLLMAAVGAWHHIRRTRDYELHRASLRIGLVTAALGSFLTIGFGFAQYGPSRETQPTKYGDDAAKQAVVAQWTDQFGAGEYLPPGWILTSNNAMIIIGFVLALALLLLPLLFRDWIIRLRVPLYLILFALPLPFLASILGWLSREIGRLPWAVYGLLTVEDALTPMSDGVMLASFLGFSLLVGALTIANWVLIARRAARGAEDLTLGRDPQARDDRADTHTEPVLA